jgi:hypothetical protein
MGIISEENPALWPDDWILHHINALENDVLRFRVFLAKKSITEMDRPPYLSDLATAIFWLFPKLNKCPKRKRDLPIFMTTNAV